MLLPILCLYRAIKMPLDHYVSQVHLRNFYSPALNSRQMYAIRKRDQHQFVCSSKDVCRTLDGSTNSYLVDQRAIEHLLRQIEPRYNDSVAKLRNGTPDPDSIYVISAFAAYVAHCSPTAMRLFSEPLRSVVATTTELMEQQGKIPPPPAILGGDSMTELLNSGKVKVSIDPKYPQAIGISIILDTLSVFGNSSWQLIHNKEDLHSAFFTSDFPVAIERASDRRVINRIIPLAPDFAVRIVPDPSFKKTSNDFSFSKFRYQLRRPKIEDIRAINKAIVQCAENLVFFRDMAPWVPDFVAKNSPFRIQPLTEKIPFPSGTMHLWSQRIGRRD